MAPMRRANVLCAASCACNGAANVRSAGKPERPIPMMRTIAYFAKIFFIRPTSTLHCGEHRNYMIYIVLPKTKNDYKEDKPGPADARGFFREYIRRRPALPEAPRCARGREFPWSCRWPCRQD